LSRSNDAATDSNWASGQPDGSVVENCVSFADQGLWSDEYCDDMHPFVCTMP
jgi:hypothetical protein